MIIIDEHGELAKYLDGIEIENIGVVKLDKDVFEISNTVIDELTMIHSSILKNASAKILAKIEKITMFILFDAKNDGDFPILPNMVDVVSGNLQTKILNNKLDLLSDLLRERQVLKSQLISINNELSDTMGNVEVELLRIKKVYEQKTPRRFDNIKGIQAYSKYAAGENVGGEFFDIHVTQNKAFVVMSSTSSYLASSSILQMFSTLKSVENISKDTELDFIEDVKTEVIEINKSKKKEISIHLFTAIIDLSKHMVSGHLFGDFKVISSNNLNNYVKEAPALLHCDIEAGVFSREFSRGERLMLCSPGLHKNWQKLNPEFIIEELMMNKDIKPLDILDEVFYQLKKDSISGFLSNDASAIMLEVQKNAMVQV
jgi:hypothetical protein